MLAILNSLNAHYIPIFQPILIILLSTFLVHRAITNKIYLLLGLLSPLSHVLVCSFIVLQYVNLTLQGEKYILARIFLYFWGFEEKLN